MQFSFYYILFIFCHNKHGDTEKLGGTTSQGGQGQLVWGTRHFGTGHRHWTLDTTREVKAKIITALLEFLDTFSKQEN